MKAVSPKLEDNLGLLPSFVQDEELHEAAWRELRHFNLAKTFLHQHPITAERKQYDELIVLLRTDMREFMDRIRRLQNNITRYNSRIKCMRFKDDEQKENWIDIITRDQLTLLLMQNVIASR